MGVDVFVLDFLASYRAAAKLELGMTLTLGRQGFHIKPTAREAATAVIRKYFPDAGFDDVSDGGPYAEKLFRFLGSTTMIAMA